MIDLDPTPQELDLTEIPQTPWFDRIVERMGVEAVRERLAREEILRTRMAPLFRSPSGMADRRLGVRILDSFFRWSRLSSRARRNFETIHVVEREWPIRNLPAGMEGYRLLQVTDFHLEFDRGVVDRLREVLQGVPYDVACLTGDFFDLVFEDDEMDLDLLDELIGLFPQPRYAVLGNHDIFAVARVLEERGVRVLMNESEVLGRPEEGIVLAGVDDARQYRTHSFERALGGLEGDLPIVMMAHTPEVYAEAADWGVDLMMSGHTHGGQVCFPGGLPFSNRFQCPRAMVSGAWDYRGVQGYTAHGCSGCKLPYRLNCSAEITIHTLRSAAG